MRKSAVTKHVVTPGANLPKPSKSSSPSLISPNGYLDREASDEFLIRLYFGPSTDYLRSCMDRAYLDFNRTLHGLAKLANAEQIREDATHKLRREIQGLTEKEPSSQADFDRWHQKLCRALSNVFRTGGFENFSIGQGQKWINMTLKYAFVMGHHRLPGYAGIFKFAHVPIDNIVLDTWAPEGMPKLTVAWSRLEDYKTYLLLQDWVRTRFSPKSPIETEFWAWLGAREKLDVKESVSRE